jgi:predicted cupin superfamily sugar epimerase
MPLTADEVIALLRLEPLPGEGGYFRETYKSDTTIPAAALPPHFAEDTPRAHATQIYYLLRAGAASKLHRVRSDEVFHHYLGAPVTQLRINPEGQISTVTIGPDLAADERPQVLAPAHWWQGAILSTDLAQAPDPNAWALLGCTVAPGFEWEDFELINESKHAHIIHLATQHHPWATRLT